MSSYHSDFRQISEFIVHEPCALVTLVTEPSTTGDAATPPVPPRPTMPRFFTEREAARVMGFPDSFQICAAGASVSNGSEQESSRAKYSAHGTNRPASSMRQNSSAPSRGAGLASRSLQAHGCNGPRGVRNPMRIYHQLGNAVCPPVVKAICRRILVALALGDRQLH